jgi:serine/threonine protein phosphatase PrpC
MQHACLGNPGHWAQQDALALQTPAFGMVRQSRNTQTHERWGLLQTRWIWTSVADGLSSLPHPAFASEDFLQCLHQPCEMHAGELPQRVRQAEAAWQDTLSHVPNRRMFRGSSTTLASLFLSDEAVCAVNCGDSRIWRIRAGAAGLQWQQLTHDHTQWQAMLDAGEVDAEADAEPASLYQALQHTLRYGRHEDPFDPEPKSQSICLHQSLGVPEAGDIYLLATDGLHGVVGEAQLQALWQADLPLAGNIARLQQAWLQTGSGDDVSLIAVQVLGDAGDSAESEAGSACGWGPAELARAAQQLLASLDAQTVDLGPSLIQRRLRCSHAKATLLLCHMVDTGLLVQHHRSDLNTGLLEFCAGLPRVPAWAVNHWQPVFVNRAWMQRGKPNK